MKDGVWRTLDEMSDSLGDSKQSLSARLRDMRKARFGAHIVNRRRRGLPKEGLFEYQLIVVTESWKAAALEAVFCAAVALETFTPVQVIDFFPDGFLPTASVTPALNKAEEDEWIVRVGSTYHSLVYGDL